MKTLIRKQKLNIDIKTAWEFFSNPRNLQKITPEYMGFEITSKLNNKPMRQGMIISYVVRPLWKIPMNWETEITEVNEPYSFVDNQKTGPYKLWHHTHKFEETDYGVEMTDIVKYAAPFGIIGKLAERIMIDQKVRYIFNYRYEKLQKLFA